MKKRGPITSEKVFKMRTISVWAHDHIWPARLLLAACHIVTVSLAWLLVQTCIGSSLDLGYWAIPFAVAVGGFILSRRWDWRSFHLFAATGSFWLVALFFQSGGSLQQILTTGYLIQQVQASKTYDQPQIKKKKSKTSFFKRIAGDKTKKTLLSILTILVALGVLFLVAALSCSISCSGSDAMALLVGLAGLAGVIVFTRLVLRRIKFGPKQKDVTVEEIKDPDQ
jgi:hypothetical protein